MRLFTVFSLIIAAVAAAGAAEEADIGREAIDFTVDYRIKDHEDVPATELLEVYNGADHYFVYDLVNNDERDVTVIGIGGVLLDPLTGDVKVNLTSGSVGPETLTQGANFTFNQHIPFNVVPANYVLTPQLFLVIDGDIKMVPVRPQLLLIVDEPISFFNPQLIFLELVLLATFAVAGYVAYDLWGRNYLYGPVTKKLTKKQPRAASPTGTTSGAAYDASWLPEGHLPKKKTKKVA